MGRRSGPAEGGTVATGDVEMMRLVADLYYLRDHSQPEIADLTGFSVSKVSRLLSQAREQGIVRITVEPPPAELTPIAHELAEHLGVQVLVTPGRATTPTIAARLCGIAAAPHVASMLPTSGVVGIGGGYTFAALTQAMPAMHRPGLTVLPLVGGWDVRNPHLDTNELVRRMADQLGAGTRLLLAPGLLDSEATKDALLADSGVTSTTDYWQRLDMAILGISGGPAARPGYGTVMDRLDDAGRERLATKGVVGDVAGYFVRIDGSLVEDEWTRRSIAIPLELLRRTPLVVAIAAGSNKVEGIIGCARSGLLHVLVTDAPTADAALRLVRAEAGGKGVRSGPPRRRGVRLVGVPA